MDKILVVDDIALNCAMLEEMLGDEYEVVTAGNGRIAIQILENHYQEFAVVLLDLIMPDVDGFACLTDEGAGLACNAARAHHKR